MHALVDVFWQPLAPVYPAWFDMSVSLTVCMHPPTSSCFLCILIVVKAIMHWAAVMHKLSDYPWPQNNVQIYIPWFVIYLFFFHDKMPQKTSGVCFVMLSQWRHFHKLFIFKPPHQTCTEISQIIYFRLNTESTLAPL